MFAIKNETALILKGTSYWNEKRKTKGHLFIELLSNE